MPIVRPVLGHHPEIGKDSFIAENATIIGNFSCGEGCSFWYGSVIRADVNAITMGNKVNVQDNATVHCTYKKFPTVIGNNVSIGHNAIVHGCTIENNVLIGMGAIVMDDCVVGEGCMQRKLAQYQNAYAPVKSNASRTTTLNTVPGIRKNSP